jgi:ABC-2 type transport system permease protein
MTGVIALSRVEALRLLRNRRLMFFTIIYPVILFLIYSPQAKGTIAGTHVSAKAYFLVSFASFGVIAASLNNNALRIAQERKEGWIRQLRLTALPSYGYVTSKTASALIAVIPAIVVTFAVGSSQGVRFSTSVWVSSFLVLWLGSLAFTALGIAIGYGVPQDAVQPVTLIIYIVGGFLGGQFYQVSGVMETIGKFFPTYWVRQLATEVVTQQPISVSGVLILGAWVVGCAALAALMYQRSSEG